MFELAAMLMWRPVPTLLRNASFVLEHYAAAGFIRLARTTLPLPSHSQVVNALNACTQALAACDPSKLGVLVDWRLAPLPPEAEDDVVPEVQKFAEPFERRALLLLGAAGDAAEQASLGGEPAAQAWAGTSFDVFFDEDLAIAYVSES